MAGLVLSTFKNCVAFVPLRKKQIKLVRCLFLVSVNLFFYV